MNGKLNILLVIFSCALCSFQSTNASCSDDFCQHGGICFEVSGSVFCDCDEAIEKGNIYQGKHCEFSHTTLCGYSLDESIENGAFCMNEGECITKDNSFECKCNDNKYKGDHCQFDIDDYTEEASNAQQTTDFEIIANEKLTVSAIVIITLSCLFGVVVLGYIAYRYKIHDKVEVGVDLDMSVEEEKKRDSPVDTVESMT